MSSNNNVVINTDIMISEIKSCLKNRDLPKAEELCRLILSRAPQNPEAHYFLSVIAKLVQKNDIALSHISTAINLKEHQLASWYMDFGNLCYQKQDYDESLKQYFKALELSPGLDKYIYNNVGAIYKNKDEFDTAIDYYHKAIQIAPKNPITYCNLALALKGKGEIDEAISTCQKALELDPKSVAAYYNWGLVLKDHNRTEEAIDLFKKVVELDKDYPDVYRDLSICLIVTKNFEEGWKVYENRYAGLVEPKPRAAFPKWDGESLEGKTIFVMKEQGNGDTIQFVRYLPALKNMGANVIFQSQPGLKKLFEQSDLQAEIIDTNVSSETLQCDYYSLLLSLPYLLKATDENIPASEGYLKTDAEKVAQYKEKYFNTEKFKVGIFWQGSTTFKNDKNRSVKLSQFYKLSNNPNIQLYSLQKGTGIEQLDYAPDDFNIINLGETFEDFSDTAAAIENLDLVISVDSAIAHLTGALGKPIWLLSFYVWEWRWFRCTERTPWYKSMNIYHQSKPRTWDAEFERVADDLMELTSKNDKIIL